MPNVVVLSFRRGSQPNERGEATTGDPLAFPPLPCPSPTHHDSRTITGNPTLDRPAATTGHLTGHLSVVNCGRQHHRPFGPSHPSQTCPTLEFSTPKPTESIHRIFRTTTPHPLHPPHPPHRTLSFVNFPDHRPITHPEQIAGPTVFRSASPYPTSTD